MAYTQIIRTEVPEVLTEEAPHGCYEGLVYIGHMLEDEHGDEVEVFEAVPCRLCNAARETS